MGHCSIDHTDPVGVLTTHCVCKWNNNKDCWKKTFAFYTPPPPLYVRISRPVSVYYTCHCWSCSTRTSNSCLPSITPLAPAWASPWVPHLPSTPGGPGLVYLLSWYISHILAFSSLDENYELKLKFISWFDWIEIEWTPTLVVVLCSSRAPEMTWDQPAWWTAAGPARPSIRTTVSVTSVLNVLTPADSRCRRLFMKINKGTLEL